MICMLVKDIYFETTQKIIDACFTVHKHMGPGLLESVYECCLVDELQSRGLEVNHGLKFL